MGFGYEKTPRTAKPPALDSAAPVLFCIAARRDVFLEWKTMKDKVQDTSVTAAAERVRRASVLELARRLDPDRPHSEQVTRLALNLFDELGDLHGMGPYERKLLEYAARLHDVGWSIGGRRHHKHSMNLIRDEGLAGFSPLEISLIAGVARYHRRALPKRKHAEFAELPERFQKVVADLAAMLRVADGLDFTHRSVVERIEASWDSRTLRLTVISLRPAVVEREKAAGKGDLIEKQFARRFRFDQQLPEDVQVRK